MLKSYLFLFFSLILVSCGNSGGGNSSKAQTQDNNESEVIRSGSSSVPNSAFTWETNVQLIDFSRDQEDKVQDALELIKKVVASEEFKKQILNHKYNGKKTFVDNGGLTNAQIYQRILNSSEKLIPGKNNAMDVTLVTYYDSSNVIGYTLPTANKIWINRKYFNNFSPVEVSSNLFHEWLHKLGFTHAYNRTPSRPYSVPYAIGYLIKSLARKFDQS